MYCSRDYQKLAFPVHKYQCASGVKTFALPPLEEEHAGWWRKADPGRTGGELLSALRKPVKECDIAEPLRSTLLAEVNNKLTAANDKPVFNEDYGILAATFTPTPVQSGLAFFHQYVGEALKRSKLPSPDPPTFFYERASPCLYPAVILQTLLKGRIFAMDRRTGTVYVDPASAHLQRTPDIAVLTMFRRFMAAIEATSLIDGRS